MSISTIPLSTARPATLDDLARVDGKAELINGTDSPEHPIVFNQADHADAEPAVPGWRMPVDRVFP